MKTRLFKNSVKVGLLALMFAAMARAESGQLRVVSTPHTYFPPALLTVGVYSGEVELVITVGVDGRVSDALVTGYTRAELMQVALEFIRDTEFSPVMRNGSVTPVRTRVDLQFSAEGVVISQTAGENQATYMDRLIPAKRVSRLGTPAELDQAPKAIRRISPGRPPGNAAPSAARVTIDFLIDETGRVRMPVLDRGEHGPLAEAAAAALLEWQFDPPTRRGQPVVVNAKQEFIFNP